MKALEVTERLTAVIHLEGMPPDREKIALWTVRKLTPKILQMMAEERREEAKRVKPKAEQD